MLFYIYWICGTSICYYWSRILTFLIIGDKICLTGYHICSRVKWIVQLKLHTSVIRNTNFYLTKISHIVNCPLIFKILVFTRLNKMKTVFKQTIIVHGSEFYFYFYIALEYVTLKYVWVRTRSRVSIFYFVTLCVFLCLSI